MSDGYNFGPLPFAMNLADISPDTEKSKPGTPLSKPRAKPLSQPRTQLSKPLSTPLSKPRSPLKETQDSDKSFEFASPFRFGFMDLVTPIKEVKSDFVKTIHFERQLEAIKNTQKSLSDQLNKFTTYFHELFYKYDYQSNISWFTNIACKVNKMDERLTKCEKDCSTFAANKETTTTVSPEKASINAGEKKTSKKGKKAYIYGTAPTSGLKIPKNYVIAVSKIPNLEVYDEKWIACEVKSKLQQKNIKITKVERVSAKMHTAATKTFKMILTTEMDIDAEEIYEPGLWPEGLKITRFRLGRRRSTKMYN